MPCGVVTSLRHSRGHAGPAWPPVPLCSEPVMGGHVGCSPCQQVPCLCFVRGLQPGEGTCPQTVNLKAHPLPLVQGRTGCVKDGRCRASPCWAGRQPRCWGTEERQNSSVGLSQKMRVDQGSFSSQAQPGMAASPFVTLNAFESLLAPVWFSQGFQSLPVEKNCPYGRTCWILAIVLCLSILLAWLQPYNSNPSWGYSIP